MKVEYMYPPITYMQWCRLMPPSSVSCIPMRLQGAAGQNERTALAPGIGFLNKMLDATGYKAWLLGKGLMGSVVMYCTIQYNMRGPHPINSSFDA